MIGYVWLCIISKELEVLIAAMIGIKSGSLYSTITSPYQG